CNQHTPLNSVRAELKGAAWLKKARIRECGRREKQHRCRRDDAEPHLSCHTNLFGPLIRKSFSPIVKPGLVARLMGSFPCRGGNHARDRLSSIALATMVLTATDVRSTNNNWCAT